MKAKLQNILNRLLERGADHASLRFENETKEEFNVIYQRLSFLRSVESSSLSMYVIRDQRTANISINQFDDTSVEEAINTLFVNLDSGVPDPAFAISPYQEPRSWSKGPMQPETDLIIERLNEFIADLKLKYPNLQYDATLSHVTWDSIYLNSNKVEFTDRMGCYGFSTIFTTKTGKRCSSMNYSFMNLKDLNTKLLDTPQTEELIRQNTEQVDTKPIPANFKGSVIFAPQVCIGLIYGFLNGQIGSFPFLSKSCKYPDHIGKQILDSKLTLKNAPDFEGFAAVSHVTSDGFVSEAATVIDAGVLRHYPINLYTANKCNKERTTGMPTAFLVEAGHTPLAEMIASIEQGILLIRDSGDSPNSDGDVSFVAKNSYYIENGKIQYPISETMIAGNIVAWLNNITAISSESYNNGSWQCPYLQVSGVDISRK